MWKRLKGLRTFQGVKSRVGISFKKRYVSPVSLFLVLSCSFDLIFQFREYRNNCRQLYNNNKKKKGSRQKWDSLFYFFFDERVNKNRHKRIFVFTVAIGWMSRQGLHPKNLYASFCSRPSPMFIPHITA